MENGVEQKYEKNAKIGILNVRKNEYICVIES